MPALTEEEYLKQQQWEKEQERKRAERTKQLEDERKFGPQAAVDRPQDVDPWEWSGMSREQQLDIDLQRRMQDPALIEKYSRMTPEQLQASAQQSLAEIEYHKEKKIQKYREERPWEAAHDKSLSSGERLLGAVDHYKKRLTDHRYDQQYGGAEDRMIVGTMKRLPISGAVWSAMSHRDKKATMDRIAGGKGTDADYMRLGRYIAEEEHKANRSGFTKALDIASYIPGYATEFFMTGGAYAAGRKAAQRGAMGAFGRAGLISKDHIPRGVGTAVKAAGFVGGTARQAAHPFMWGRAADEFLQRRDPGFKLKGKPGSRGFDVVANEHSESIGRHVYEAMWSHYLEIMTERSGATLMKGAGAPFRALTARLPKTHLQKVGASVMRRSREFSNATGMSFNPIEEYVEEVAGSVLKGSRYTAGEDPHLGRLWKNFITNPTNPQAQKELWEETGPMLAAFAMAGVGGAALSPMQDRTDELAQQIDYQQQLLDQMPEGTPEHAQQQEVVEGLREQKIERDSTQEQAREEYMERGPRYTGDRRNREAVEAYAEELTEWRKENPLNAALREIDYRSEGVAKGYIDAEISALEAASNEEEFRSAQASLERKMEILEKSNLSRKDVEELFPDPETRPKALRSARGRSRFMGTLEGMSSQLWQAVKSRGEELGIGVEAPARKQVMAHAKLSDTYVRGEEENRPKATKPDVQIHNMTLEEFRKENYQEETEWYLREKVLADGTKVGDSPERLLQYYEEKYPDSLGALGIRIGGAIETEKSGPLGNRAAVVWKRDEEDKAQLKGAIIVLPPDAGLVVTRHEIEHLLDVIHGYDPSATEHKELRDDGIAIGAEKFGRFNHKYFSRADYLHRALVRDALLEGEQVSEEVLAQYKNDPAIQELFRLSPLLAVSPDLATSEAAAPVPEKKEGAAAIYQYLELHDISENPTDAELLGLEKGEELDVDIINEKHEAIHKEVDTLKLGPRAKESQELLNRLSRARLNLVDAAKEEAAASEAAAPVEVDQELAKINQGLDKIGTVGTEAEQVAELQKLIEQKRKRGDPTPKVSAPKTIKVSEELKKRAEAAGVPLEGENLAQRVLDAESAKKGDKITPAAPEAAEPKKGDRIKSDRWYEVFKPTLNLTKRQREAFDEIVGGYPETIQEISVDHPKETRDEIERIFNELDRKILKVDFGSEAGKIILGGIHSVVEAEIDMISTGNWGGSPQEISGRDRLYHNLKDKLEKALGEEWVEEHRKFQADVAYLNKAVEEAISEAAEGVPTVSMEDVAQISEKGLLDSDERRRLSVLKDADPKESQQHLDDVNDVLSEVHRLMGDTPYDQKDMKRRVLVSESLFEGESENAWPLPVYVATEADMKKEDVWTVGLLLSKDGTFEMFEGNAEASPETLDLVNKLLGVGESKVTVWTTQPIEIVEKIKAGEIPPGIFVSPSREYAKGFWRADQERELVSFKIPMKQVSQHSDIDWLVREAPAAPKAAEPKKGDRMPRILEAVELPEEVKREAAKKAAPFKKKVQEVEDKRLSVWEEGAPTLEELKELSIDELRTMVRKKYGLMKRGEKWEKAPFPLSGKGVTKAYLASKLAAPQRDNIMVGQSVHYISEGEEVGPSLVVGLGRGVVLVKGNVETRETIIDRNDIVKVIHGGKAFELDNDGGVIEILFSDAEEIAENGGRDGKKWRETFEKFWLYYAPQWADWGQKIRKERWYRQYFNVGGLLGKDLHSQLEMLEGKTAANVEAVHQQLAALERALRKSSWAEGIKKRDKVLRNLSNEKKKVLNGILKIPLEEMDAYSKTHSLPEGVVPVAKEIRKRINSLSRDLREIFESDVDKKLGLEKKYGEDLFEVLLSNEGIYLRRNYQVFNDPKYGEKLFEEDPDWVDRDGNKVKLLDEARKMIREGEYYYKRRKKMKRLWRKRIKGLRRDLEDQIKKEKEQLEADNVPAAAIGESLKVSREDFWRAAKEKAKRDAEEGLEFMTDAEVEGALKAKLAPEKGKQMSIRTRNSLGRVDMNSLIQRKLDDEYYHRVIRTLYGEITDFDLNALATVERVSSMINQTQAQEVMLEHFKEVGWVDVDPETGEIPKRETFRNGEEYRHKMPDNQPEFGVFQGLYLTMDAKQALIDYYGNPNNTQEMSRFERFQKILFFKVYGKTIGLARASKTILSTTVQWRNFWANATLGFVNGHFSLDGTVGQNFIDAFAITAGQQGRFQWSEGRLVDRDGTVVGRQHVPEIVQELVSRKVIGDSPSREIENLLNASWDAPMSDVIRDNVNPTDKKGLADAISIVKKGGPLDKVWNVSASLYQAGDDIWKVFGWLREVQILEKAFPTIESIQNIGAHKKGKKKGDRASLAKLKGSTEADRAEWIKDEAALRIRDMYPTFSNAPFWVKAVRWFPLVGTFPTYFEELVRTQYIEFFRMTARDIQSGNPVLARRAMERRLRWVGAHAALGAGIKAMLGLLVRLFGCTPVGGDDEALLREGALPPWSKHSSIFAWRCGKGSPKVIDLSFVLPLERPWDAVRAGISEEGFLDKGTSVLNELVGDVITTDMAVSRSAEAVMGRTGSGAPLYMESDSTARKTVRRAAHLWGIFEPGVVNSTRRIITGLAKKPSMTGRKYNPAVEALSASFGTRVNDIDVPESLNYQIAKFNRNLRGSRREMERYGMSDYQPSMIFPLDWEGSLTQFKRELPKAERARKQVFSQGHNAVEMARRMGMKDSDIALTLKKHNLSKRDIAALLNKTYPPYLPSKPMRIKILKQGYAGKQKWDIIKQNFIKEVEAEKKRQKEGKPFWSSYPAKKG